MDAVHKDGSVALAGEALCAAEFAETEVLRLFDGMRERLLRYAVSFGIAVPEAEDVTQEAFLALYRHLRAGKPQDNLPGWLFRTVHHLALKRRAKLQTEGRPGGREGELPETVSAAPGPEETLLMGERQARLHSVVRALPETDRMCVHLRAEGCRYREIAAALGISLGSVAASMARTLAKLREVDAR